MPPPPLAPADRRLFAAAAHRVDAIVQVARWKSGGGAGDGGSGGIVGSDGSSGGGSGGDNDGGGVATRPVERRVGRRPRFGRLFSQGEIVEEIGWEFSLVEFPITPLQSRSVGDEERLMALWRGERVVVRVVRGGWEQFRREGEYLYRLGRGRGIASLLGGAWEGERRNGGGGRGYLIMPMVGGASLDKVVREGKMRGDVVGQIWVLQRVVEALVFAQTVEDGMTHQDLHPGNVLLVEGERGRNGAHGGEKEQGRGIEGESTEPGTVMPGRKEKGLPKIVKRQPSNALSIGTVQTSSSSNSAASVDTTRDENRVARSSDAPVAVSPISSYSVMVMDFAPVAEAADGSRKIVSWTNNEVYSGYCAPEKATTPMWRRVQRARERDRDKGRDRERRAMVSRSLSTHRPYGPRMGNAKWAGGNGYTKGRASMGTRPDESAGAYHQRRPFDVDGGALPADEPFVDATEFDVGRPDNHKVPTLPMMDRLGRRGLAQDGADTGRVESRLRRRRDGGTYGRSHGKHGGGGVDGADYVYSNGGGHTGQGFGNYGVSSAKSGYNKNVPLDEGNTAPDKEDKASENRMSRIDVWSVGWLLYYMATGKHPPTDAWARRCGVDGRELHDVAPECRDIIQMCVQRDVSKRACMRDVKRRIDSTLQTLMFAKGVALLETDRHSAFVLMDKAVGIKVAMTCSRKDGDEREQLSAVRFASLSPSTSRDANSADGDPGTTISHAKVQSLEEAPLTTQRTGYRERITGLNQRTRAALSCLPVVIVRRVEWEAAARYLSCSAVELRAIRKALVNERWNKADVRNGASAVEYLGRRSAEGVASAHSALGWIYRWGAGGVRKDIQEAMSLWLQAVEAHDAEAANGLGLLYHHGRDKVQADGLKARTYYRIAVDEGYPAAAVNMGVMLHDGAAGLPADGVAARELYEMACAHGDAIAANNLGLLLQHGAEGVKRDAPGAVAAYETAIKRGERHHACRNLGELLWEGAKGVERDREQAVELFAMAIARGDESSRETTVARLRKLIGEAEEEEEGEQGEKGLQWAKGVEKDILEQCQRLLLNV